MIEEDEVQPYNAAEPTQVAERKKASKLRDQQVKDQTRTVMSSPEGRLWIWELLAACGVYSNPFSLDPYSTAFACGKQNVGQEVLAKIMKECPELYLIMQKEQN